MATTDQIREAFEQYAARMSAGDTEGIIAMFSPEAYIEDPVGNERTQGPDAIRAHFTGAIEQAASTLELLGPVRAVEPSWGAAPLQARTKMGDAVYVIDIVDVFTFDDDGLITSLTAYWGTANVAPES